MVYSSLHFYICCTEWLWKIFYVGQLGIYNEAIDVKQEEFVGINKTTLLTLMFDKSNRDHSHTNWYIGYYSYHSYMHIYSANASHIYKCMSLNKVEIDYLFAELTQYVALSEL